MCLYALQAPLEIDMNFVAGDVVPAEIVKGNLFPDFQLSPDDLAHAALDLLVRHVLALGLPQSAVMLAT
jgi:hypothetical protein